MKFAKAVVLSIMILIVAGISVPPARAADVSFSFFHSNLSPHGSWLASASYGRVWQPEVYATGWNPYYDGQWVYTDCGWTWVSDYAWGAIPYHYGTWVLDPYLGWVWVPGYVWAPAWVVFRTGPDYIGWAPVSPTFSVGFWSSFRAPATGPFVFVSANHFLDRRVGAHFVPEHRTKFIINNTRVVNNITVENNVVVNRGPDLRIVERATGRRVREVPIEKVSRVAPGGRVSRAELAAETRNGKHRLRAAEPVPEANPLSSRQRDSDRQQVRPRTAKPDQSPPDQNQPRRSRRDETRPDRVRPASPGPDTGSRLARPGREEAGATTPRAKPRRPSDDSSAIDRPTPQRAPDRQEARRGKAKPNEQPAPDRSQERRKKDRKARPEKPKPDKPHS